MARSTNHLLPTARGFTLVELMVAVGLLLVVVIAVSRVFSTASKVTSLGEANNDLLQETAAIERQIRSDFARLDFDGCIAIQCVAVQNNVNRIQFGSAAAPLVDPSRPDDAIIRCDQLVFFSKGAQTSVRFTGNQDLSTISGPIGMAKSASARVLYGHGVQLPELLPETSGDVVRRKDPLRFQGDPSDPQDPGLTLVPWSFDPVPPDPQGPVGSLDYAFWLRSGGGIARGTQPEARDWILARQVVLLADDGANKVYLHAGPPHNQEALNRLSDNNNSAIALWEASPAQGTDAPLRDNDLMPNLDLMISRVDVAASSLNDLRRQLAPDAAAIKRAPDVFPQPPYDPPNLPPNQRRRIINCFFGPAAYHQLAGYVRSEKFSPSMNRQDVMLTTPTLATNCSNFIVDWTWEDFPTVGFSQNQLSEITWFGFPDSVYPAGSVERRGVFSLTDLSSTTIGAVTDAVRLAIEGSPPVVSAPYEQNIPVRIYTAVFGFNGDRQTFTPIQDPAPNAPAAQPIERADYTPWPTAIRLTMQLHDSEGRIEQGRTVQLVIELPRRPTS